VTCYVPVGTSLADGTFYLSVKRVSQTKYRGVDALAIYHLSIKVMSRSKGKSVVAASAYRAGTIIKNEYSGITYDYTRKKGIVHTEIMLPKNAPKEYESRAVLWNAVEKVEKNINAQLTREIEIALPRELTPEQNKALVQAYVKKHFVDEGMCADICIHDKNDGNPHCHILLTMRPINEDGSWGAKAKKEYIFDENGNRIRLISGAYKTRKINTIDWNDIEKSEQWREGWAKFLNSALKENGFNISVDHRSYKRQGIDKIPTIHLGQVATQLERKGIRTERGDTNREINAINMEIRQLKARIKKTRKWLHAQPLADAPNLIDASRNAISWRNLNSRYQKIKHLKSMADTLNFLLENGVHDMEELAEKAESMHNEIREISENTNKINRRIKTLDTHFAHCKSLEKYKPYAKKYNSLTEKERTQLQAKYPQELTAYKTANVYFRKVLNGRKDIPLKMWEEEKAKLTSERGELVDRYYILRDDIKSVEGIKRGAERLVSETQIERGGHQQEQSYETGL